MQTLNDLRRLAEKIFPGVRHSIAHILIAWAREDMDGELRSLLQNTGLSLEGLAGSLMIQIETPNPQDKQLLLETIARISGETIMGVHLLKTLCNNPEHRFTKALITAGLAPEILLKNLQENEKKNSTLEKMGIAVNEADSPLLRYGRDLTELASNGAFSDLYPRPEEMEILTDVLQRKRKGNAVLTGPAGVGKTCMVELLAFQIAKGKIPSFAQYYIFEISLGKLVAGTKYRGDFEERFESIMASLNKQEHAILFLDEIHLLMGAGRAEGMAMDGANMIKPFLVKESIRVIGATTHEEYQRYIVQDPALARRFQEVKLSEPSPDLLLSLVKHQAEVLARHHHVQIPAPVIDRAIELTDRYLPNRSQPDKTLDLLDSAAVAAKRAHQNGVDYHNLLNTFSKSTGFSMSVLSGEDKAALKNLSNVLKKKIVAQDAVIDKIVPSLVHRRIDIGNPDRPIGVYLFAGDTGVGKTELARCIAATFFGNEKKLIHLDMSEYANPGAINKLIGAPPAYVGHEEDGMLTKWLQKEASGVVIFDEIEKAAPEVHKLLLGLLDNGRVTSGKGLTVYAKSCVIILTTNAVTSKELNRQGLGFGVSPSQKPNLHELLSTSFPREFLSRMDEILPFRSLTQKDLKKILRLRLEEAVQRLRSKKVTLVFDEDRLLNFLFTRLEADGSGARGIARLLERNLIQPLAMALLSTGDDNDVTVALEGNFYEEGVIEFSPHA